MAKREFRFRGESQVLDAAARSAAPGSFVDLPDGVTHYELVGPPEGRLVVLVHGFSVPYYIWDPTFAPLVQAGCRVLRYDLYGRGYSDRPDVVYNQDLFVRQLWHLLAALHIDRPVDLVGLSIGGAIAVAFTDRHPDMVNKLCLISPAGLPVKRSPLAGLVEMPLLGEWLMSLFGDKLLVDWLRGDFRQPAKFPEYQAKYRVQMKYVGFKRAILSTMRSSFLDDMTEAYRRVGQQKRPVLLIWGREDQTVPFSTSEKVRAAIPQVEFHAIDDAGHVSHYERPEIVNHLLIEFLRK
jgi:pimeloyl-ACP methyl ester carboxylesterase